MKLILRLEVGQMCQGHVQTAVHHQLKRDETKTTETEELKVGKLISLQ